MLNFEVKKWDISDTDHCWLEHLPINLYEEHTACKHCGTTMDVMTRVETTHGVCGLSLGGCFQCGHIQKTRAIRFDTLARHFHDRWLDNREHRDFIERQDVFKTLQPWLPETGRILEIGCGSGTNLITFAKNGYEVYGVDPSCSEIEIAKNRGIVNTCVGTAEGYLEEATEIFDVIFLYNVVQFLIDPFAILSRCIELLKDDGVLYLSSGNFWSINIASSSHLGIIQNYPTLPTFQRWAKREGMVILGETKQPVSLLMKKAFIDAPKPLLTIPTQADWRDKIRRDLERSRGEWPFGVRSINLHRGRKIFLGRQIRTKQRGSELNFVYDNELPAVLLK